MSRIRVNRSKRRRALVLSSWLGVILVLFFTAAGYAITGSGPASSESACNVILTGSPGDSISAELGRELAARGLAVVIADSENYAAEHGDSTLIAIFMSDSALSLAVPPTGKPAKSLLNFPDVYLPEMFERTLYNLPGSGQITSFANAVALLCSPPDSTKLSVLAEDSQSLDARLVNRILAETQRKGTGNPKFLKGAYDSMLKVDWPDSLNGWLYFNYAGLGEGTEKRTGLETADSLFSVCGDELGRSACRLKLAEMAQDLGEQYQYYQFVAKHCEAEKDSLALAHVLHRLGQLDVQQQRPDQAEQFFTRSAAINEAIGNYYEATESYVRLGELLQNSGKAEEAEGALDRALSLATEMQSEKNLVRVYFLLGNNKALQGRPEEAESHYLSAMDLMEILGDSLGLAKIDVKLGNLYLKKDDLEAAKFRYESALGFFKALDDSSGILQCHFSLGELNADQGRWEESQEHFAQALHAAQKLDNPRLVGSVLFSKGIAHVKEGRYQEGYEEVKRSFELTDGSVYGTPEESRRFLARLEKLAKNHREIEEKKKQLESEL